MTNAFRAHGCVTNFDQKKVAEVVEIRILRHGVEVRCNWIPENTTQKAIFERIQSRDVRGGYLDVTLPCGLGWFSATGDVDGKVLLSARREPATLIFRISGHIDTHFIDRPLQLPVGAFNKVEQERQNWLSRLRSIFGKP